MIEYKNVSFSRRIRDTLQRLTFHNRAASLVSAELRYLFSRHGGERDSITMNVISTFRPSVTTDGKENKPMIKDYYYSRAYYAVDSKEYFLFGLAKSKDPEKEKFVGWRELYCYYLKLNKIGNPDVFELKDKTYDVFRKYYKRKLIIVDSDKQKTEFQSFFEAFHSGIIKPFDDYGGHGVEIIHCSTELTPNQVWERVCNRIPFVVEELIHQAPEMNEFYPHAVNTIRYNTFFHNGNLTRLQAVFRIGRGESVVDNATSGGIYALIDTETGRIKGPARSFRGELFETHPDTGTRFEGNFIPHWEELNSLLEEIVRVVPEQKQVGWDFALSTDGWVMVEGNTTPAMQSFELNHGLRDKLSETFGSVVKMWSSEKR